MPLRAHTPSFCNPRSYHHSKMVGILYQSEQFVKDAITPRFSKLAHMYIKIPRQKFITHLEVSLVIHSTIKLLAICSELIFAPG